MTKEINFSSKQLKKISETGKNFLELAKEIKEQIRKVISLREITFLIIP